MPFWKCYYHFVWATHQRQPLITLEIERVVLASINLKSAELECPILAMNGIEDHIHIAVALPPKLAAAEWVRNAKGLSAREVNAMFPNLPTHFKWQSSYGALTLGAKHIPMLVAYIQAQKEHHANNTTEPYLERVEAD